MPSSAEVEVLNFQLARQINQEALANPQSPFAGKLVGIADGAVVVVADSWKDVIARLRAAQPNPRKIFGLAAGVDVSRPVLFAPDLQSQDANLPTQQRPHLQLDLVNCAGHKARRSLLVEPGEGCPNCPFDLLLAKDDCLGSTGVRTESVTLQGAYSGVYPVYLNRVVVAQLGFDEVVHAVAVPETPPGCDGIASQRFLARFRSGNFGSVEQVERALFGGPPTVCVADIVARNRELGRQIYQEARSNPNSPYAGKHVGIANGQVVVVSDDPSIVSAHLHMIEQDRRKICSANTTVDYSRIERV